MSCVCKLFWRPMMTMKYTYEGAEWRLIGVDNSTMISVWHCHRRLLTTSCKQNKAVIDRRLFPGCCQLGSYSKRPKSSTMRPLAYNWCYCSQSIAKPKAACALRFSWVATSSNLGLSANVTSSIKSEVHNGSLRCKKRTELKCTKSLVKIGHAVPKTDKHTHTHKHTQTDTHAHHNTLLPYQGQSKTEKCTFLPHTFWQSA